MVQRAATQWDESRIFGQGAFSAQQIARARDSSIAVCLPARECAATIADTVAALVPLRTGGVIDRIVVVDAASEDGTAELASSAGADVLEESELMASHGPVLGKGDAMWRALSVIGEDLVCFLDADVENFSADFAVGLLGPLVCAPDAPAISFVKAFYRRPFRSGPVEIPDGGGRVNQLMARPALALLYPELAGIRQPLAGEVAARRELLMAIPFTTGYGVEVAMLLDVLRHAGAGAIAQADLGEHHNSHQPLLALRPMAESVLAVITRALERDGVLDGGGRFTATAPPERPPLRDALTAGTA